MHRQWLWRCTLNDEDDEDNFNVERNENATNDENGRNEKTTTSVQDV
jgi:hypothetical protein